MAVYSIGFFAFWLFAAGSSALTCFLQRTASEINRRRDGGFDAGQSARGERALH
jgi:hypothetical protein